MDFTPSELAVVDMKLPPQETPKGPSLVLVGTDHRHAPLELREQVSLGSDEIGEAIRLLQGHEAL